MVQRAFFVELWCQLPQRNVSLLVYNFWVLKFELSTLLFIWEKNFIRIKFSILNNWYSPPGRHFLWTTSIAFYSSQHFEFKLIWLNSNCPACFAIQLLHASGKLINRSGQNSLFPSRTFIQNKICFFLFSFEVCLCCIDSFILQLQVQSQSSMFSLLVYFASLVKIARSEWS